MKHTLRLFSALACSASAMILAAFSSPAASALPQTSFNDATPLQWSVRMADSQIARLGDKLAWKADGSGGKWDYTAGLFTLSLLDLNAQVPNPAYVAFTTNAIGTFITDDGAIHGYKPAEYQLDAINPGKTVIALYQLNKEERYAKAAAALQKQFATQPRVTEGGFWHKTRYTNQMWLDGLYMGAPFYAEYTKLFGGPETNFDDIGKQFAIVKKHLRDSATGLYFHGWDEKKIQPWANPATGASSNFWGRGMGWYAMACVDTLDYLPTNHPAHKQISEQFKNIAKALVKYQDPASGLWWQVMDKGNTSSNYLEATASAMFVYSLAKGVNDGLLPAKYTDAILKGYNGLITRLIKTNADGSISLTQCCQVAGLGFTSMRGGPRDGSFAYYLSEPIVENDLKGVGPFILAGLEVQKLLGLPMTTRAITMTPEDKARIAKAWAEVPVILARIQAPKFPDKDFPITDFGATADGQTDNSAAIAKAIAACHAAGGGRVVVPAGDFLTGPIHLLSNVNLHLMTNATLKFTLDTKAYLPLVLTRFEGMECWNYSPLIYAYEQENIAVTGDGTLDGQASDENWWSWKGRKVQPGEPEPKNQTKARKLLDQMTANGTPVDERRFGEGSYLRPAFIQPYRSKNILIEGVKIRRSPMWEITPALCTNVTVRNVNIVSHGPNNDGCDPESCRDVLIEDCLFDTGDDCIAIKSGRNNDGRRINVPSENIIIRRCIMADGHGGVTIGSEISGGCRNVFVEDCDMDSPDLDRAIRFKSNAIRGGTVENVFVRNVKVGQVKDAVIQVDFVYEEGANGPYKPVVRNVVLQNVTVAQTPRVLNIVGFPGAEISDVRIYDSTFQQIKKPDVIKEASVKLVNCVLQPAN